MDVAKQMQSIRNERGFKNARELAEHLGMSEARVKRYMSIFGASDHLREMSSTHNIALGPMLELARCEKRMGEAPVRKLIARVVKGEMGVGDLSKLRGKPTQPSKARSSRAHKPRMTIKATSEALLKACAREPDAAGPHVEALIAELQKYLPGSREAA